MGKERGCFVLVSVTSIPHPKGKSLNVHMEVIFGSAMIHSRSVANLASGPVQRIADIPKRAARLVMSTVTETRATKTVPRLLNVDIAVLAYVVSLASLFVHYATQSCLQVSTNYPNLFLSGIATFNFLVGIFSLFHAWMTISCKNQMCRFSPFIVLHVLLLFPVAIVMAILSKYHCAMWKL